MLKVEPKSLAVAILAKRGGGDGHEAGGDPLEAEAAELVEAIKEGDAGKVAECLRYAFQLLESEPHAEG